MKKILLKLCFLPLISFGQSMNMKWTEIDGREFSFNSQTNKFTFSMNTGDKIEYITNDNYGPLDSVKETSGSVNK